MKKRKPTFMKYYIEILKKELDSIQCDFCHKIYNKKDDLFQIQEFHSINFIGGYGSVFGDGNHVECDICQHCLKITLEGHCRVY